MKKLICLIILIFTNLSSLWTDDNLSVILLNPGESGGEKTGAFWEMMSRYMTAAADDFSIDLDIRYAERDYFLMVEQAEAVALEASHPDYIILVNEKSNDIKLMQALEEVSSKIVFMHNGPDTRSRSILGNEREKYKNWIGTFLTDNRKGGFLLMEELYRISPKPVYLGAVSGDKNTPVSSIRINGMLDFISLNKDIHLHQIIYADWSYKAGEKIGRGLTGRYPQLTTFWAANDAMALGAVEGFSASGKQIITGGQGGFYDALDAIEKGELQASLGGHTLLGAYLLVMLYDYHQGIDFAVPESIVELDNLFILTDENISDFKKVVENPEIIDFSLLSRSSNPDLEEYDFSFSNILKNYNNSLVTSQ